MFSCSLKLILSFFEILCVYDYKLEYWYMIMYLCEKLPL
jgi:hypothetical protein